MSPWWFSRLREWIVVSLHGEMSPNPSLFLLLFCPCQWAWCVRDWFHCISSFCRRTAPNPYEESGGKIKCCVFVCVINPLTVSLMWSLYAVLHLACVAYDLKGFNHDVVCSLYLIHTLLISMYTYMIIYFIHRFDSNVFSIRNHSLDFIHISFISNYASTLYCLQCKASEARLTFSGMCYQGTAILGRENKRNCFVWDKIGRYWL